MDERIFHLLYAAWGGGLTRVAAAFTVIGEGWVVLGLLPLLLVRRFRGTTLTLVSVLALTAAVVALLKMAVHRVRPCNGLEGVSCLWGPAPTDFSFPSGHAAGSFALVTFVGAIVLLSEEPQARPTRLGVLVLGLAAATCIALSRVYLGVHFPGDVLAGSCLGALMGLAGARVHLGSRVAGRE